MDADIPGAVPNISWSGKRPFKSYFNSTFISTPQNHRFESDFYQKFHDNPPVLYNQGGSR
jgi:hypothetical protein